MSLLFYFLSYYHGLHLTSVLGIPLQLRDWEVWPSAVEITWLLRHRQEAPPTRFSSVDRCCPLVELRWKRLLTSKSRWISVPSCGHLTQLHIYYRPKHLFRPKTQTLKKRWIDMVFDSWTTIKVLLKWFHVKKKNMLTVVKQNFVNTKLCCQ